MSFGDECKQISKKFKEINGKYNTIFGEKGKLKLPANDEECRALLRDICGRTDEQIDAIFQFARLAKELK